MLLSEKPIGITHIKKIKADLTQKVEMIPAVEREYVSWHDKVLAGSPRLQL